MFSAGYEMAIAVPREVFSIKTLASSTELLT
jgi:hypothetical protein